MTLLFGNARLSSSDYAYVRNMDQQLVYTAAQQYIQMANEQMMDAWDLIVEPTPTAIYKERYKLGMTGRMQEVSELGTGAPVTLGGAWDVAYELRNFHEPIAVSDVDYAYMTVQELQFHVDGILTRARNAKRHQALYHLFNNTQKTFVDKRWGALTIEPLANGDAVLYPPVEGSETEATENHYLGSAYAAASIDNTNNPYKTIAEELIEHGMNETNDVPVAFLINSAQVTVTSALTNFFPYITNAITPGADTDLPTLPPRNLPGKIIGYILGYGWVSVWNWIPAGYIVGVNMTVPQPYRMRIDPPETGLGSGMVVLLPEERNGVITFDSWRMRFGLGGANRLSAVVMDLTNTDSDYDIPTDYV
jgi:hypothetical protein